MTWTWRVQARTGGDLFGWKTVVDRLSRQTADETADFYSRRYPEWEIRLLDDSTAETVHVEKASAA